MTQPTAFARVIGAMQATLQADPPISANVYRGSRTRPIPRDQQDALAVRPGQAEVTTGVGMGAPGIWLTAAAVECYVRAGSDVDDRLDVLLGAAVERLQLDPSLGGLVGEIAPQGIAWDFDTDGEQTACATVTFFVRHATAAGSLFP